MKKNTFGTISEKVDYWLTVMHSDGLVYYLIFKCWLRPSGLFNKAYSRNTWNSLLICCSEACSLNSDFLLSLFWVRDYFFSFQKLTIVSLSCLIVALCTIFIYAMLKVIRSFFIKLILYIRQLLCPEYWM
jgi:magnesium-transporting ATPase (P-type)